MSNYLTWAETELRKAGLLDEDSDYGGMLGEEVLKLVKVFSDGGHSGMSAAFAADIFKRLADWKPLTPLTASPDEWMHIAEEMAGRPDVWQSRRRPDAFSNDGGRRYYMLDEPQPRWRRVFARRLRGGHARWFRKHTSELCEEAAV